MPQESVEIFLQEASENLQFLREYAGVLQDPYPVQDDLQRLYIAAHTLEGSSGLYGFPLFREVTSRLSHIFQYVLNASLSHDAAGPLVEFVSEAVALLESDLLMVSATGAENVEEIENFKERYSFAFQAAAVEQPETPQGPEAAEITAAEEIIRSEEEKDDILEVCEEVDVPMVVAAPAQVVRQMDLPDLEPDGDVPAEILEFFVPEAEEHILAAQQCVLNIEKNSNPEDINRLFRAIHTIKGSAAQVGLQRIARVAHRAEDLMGRLRDGVLQPTPEITDICLEAIDVLKRFVYSEWESELQMQATAKALLLEIGQFAPDEGEEAVVAEVQVAIPEISTIPAPKESDDILEMDEIAAPASDALMRIPDSELQLVLSAAAVRQQAAASPSVSQEPEPEFIAGLRSKEPATAPLSKSVRIALERLDSMMNAVGELVINRTRMLGRLGELENLADVLNFSKGRMSDKIESFQEKYEFGRLAAALAAPRRHQHFETMHYDSGYKDVGRDTHSEFSELEMDRYDDFSILSRSLAEISADITEVLTQLDGFVRRIDGDIDEFTKLAHRLQDEISEARMVPIGNLYTRLSRTLRDACKAAGKQVELKLSGAETELDNNIIQQVSDPLIHLVRNSVAHGIETPHERLLSGKPEQGVVSVSAYHRGNHIFVEVEDDGAGIDFGKVRSHAIEVGILNAEDAGGFGDHELLELLFHPGFSTADRKTELAGRGVGLDVVKANIESLNGEVTVDTKLGTGTRFTLKVPLTLVISQALFLRCGKHTFGVPITFVEEIRRLPAEAIEEVDGKLVTRVRDAAMDVYRLDWQLGLEPMQAINGAYRLVVVNVVGGQVGLLVEEVLRKDEIVIKNLGDYMRHVKMYSGATIAPDGSLILLLDVNRLVSSMDERQAVGDSNTPRIPGLVAKAVIDTVAAPKTVVLVDDSISVRKFVGRMLEKAGYHVRLACDGLEALEVVSQHGCDLVITDLEMPRTNGYELMAHLRQEEKARNIPVMVVTSRAGAKHRDRAMKDGAAAFMTKPVQEEQFVEAVQKLIGTAVQS
jgi:chemosensory pili system protein ChpA (sensor histidine kinase/response regulator)